MESLTNTEDNQMDMPSSDSSVAKDETKKIEEKIEKTDKDIVAAAAPPWSPVMTQADWKQMRAAEDDMRNNEVDS